MACKDCVHVRKPMRGFYNQVYCDYFHIHVSDQPYYDASTRCNGYKTKQTNADRIRMMTNEELAKVLRHPCDIVDHVPTEWCNGRNCGYRCALDWLKEEVADKEGSE